MAKREFMQLCGTYDPDKHLVAGWFMSTKLDGERCFWDGGISRGIPALEIPWANTDKDGRLTHQPIATGLWTRNGKVINAPEWWLEHMPAVAIDGELWMGNGAFQDLSSIVRTMNRTAESDSRWSAVKLLALDSPLYEQILADGNIDTIFYKKKFVGAIEWATRRSRELGLRQPICLDRWPDYRIFDYVYHAMKRELEPNEFFNVVEQKRLSHNMSEAAIMIHESLDQVLQNGGEGLVLRRPGSHWLPERTNHMLKVKRYFDAEATVVGYMWGKKRLSGRLGALIVQWKPNSSDDRVVEFELSGFTDAERALILKGTHANASVLGTVYAGKRCGDNIDSEYFPIGSTVTFRYRELTTEGIPREASYVRKYRV